MHEQSNVWQILLTTLRATKEIKLCQTTITHVLKRNVIYRESESEYMLERERERYFSEELICCYKRRNEE